MGLLYRLDLLQFMHGGVPSKDAQESRLPRGRELRQGLDNDKLPLVGSSSLPIPPSLLPNVCPTALNQSHRASLDLIFIADFKQPI